MMKNSILLVIVSLLICYGTFAQETFPRNDVKDKRTNAYAFTNARIIVDYQTKIENGTLLIKEGKIVNVGTNVSVPSGYSTIDLKGKTIYPSLVDIHTNYGLPAVKRPERQARGGEQINSNTKGAYNANQAIKSEYNAASEFTVSDGDAKKLRNLGFGAVLTFKGDGIARGSSAFVSLGNDTENNVMISPKVAAHYSFNRGSSRQNYPSSPMGFIALLRQTYMDAEWFGALKKKPFIDQSLESWAGLQSLPQIFEATNWLSILQADKVGDEFGKQYIIKSGGDDYQRIKEIKATNASLVVPLNFPSAYDVDDPIETQKISLEDMLHWELAPANLSVLEANNVNIAITSHRTGQKNFFSNLRKAIDHGLSEEAALKALTYTPAHLINMSDKVGSIKKGLLANFLITSGNLFDKDAVLYENWVQGKKYAVTPMDVPDYSGKYDLTVGNSSYKLEISGKAGKQSAKIVANDSAKTNVKTKIADEIITMSFNPDKAGDIRLSGWKSGKELKGEGQLANGDWVSWKATYRGEIESKEKKNTKSDSNKKELGKILYPFIAYGNESLPSAETILFKNATVWTNEAEGILSDADVLIKDGKIIEVGKNLSGSGAKVIDASGKHLTSGVIDEHTHIAIPSWNDVATNSGMVRMGDVIKPDDINIYRQLSGGVTAAQILHGSANPVGGQSALIKFRWGASPEEMKINGADGFIKFALGENVKRSGSTTSIRYPKSRMGVEQVYVDAFTNALAYEKKWKTYNGLSAKLKLTGVKPRRDLVDETMLEILREKRFVTCHSYVQSEINMIMHVAKKFNFRLNTFTHILEGYKVADKMNSHGVGGATFADWWAYKWEVRYAIPYNANLMRKAGVTVAINSDNAEMARRLNQEAAKSVKYGGMPEEDAWKMVTLNPAKLLHLDDRMGSIKKGKDADLVLWSDHPLSIYAKAEKTLVDGTVYFDIEKDLEQRKAIKEERARLINKMKAAKSGGSSTRKPTSTPQMLYDCDYILGEEFFQSGTH